jgi:phosphoserine phosphatase
MTHAPYALTLVADRRSGALSPALVERVRDALRGGPADTLCPGEAADVPLSAPPDPVVVAAAIGAAAVDAITVRTRGRRKGLLLADMDGTIVEGETLDELAAIAGVGEQVAAITRASMNGDIDFAAALRERVAMLKGVKLDLLERAWAGVRLNDGAAELVATMRAHNALTVLVSGGFTFFSGRVAEVAGFDAHRANVLLDDGAALTGEVEEPILDRDAKLATLEELAAARGLKLAATLAVGDGANDLAMLRGAGIGVAYRAKPVVAAEARARVDFSNLRALLFIQGYREEQIEG